MHHRCMLSEPCCEHETGIDTLGSLKNSSGGQTILRDAPALYEVKNYCLGALEASLLVADYLPAAGMLLQERCYMRGLAGSRL